MRRMLLALLLLTVPLSTMPLGAVAADTPLFLWHAEKDGAVIDLLGSIHAGQAAWYPLDDRIEAAFTTADTLACELDITDMAVSMKIAGLIMTEGTYPAGESLRDHITPETWERLQAVEGLAVPASTLESMRPGLAAATVVQSLMIPAGLDPEQGIDRHLLQRADEMALPIVALETPEQQIALIFGPDAVIDGLMLDEALAETPETMLAMLDELVAAWSAGDPAAMEAVFRSDWNDDPRMVRFHEELLVGRNQGMAEKLQDRRGHWFVVVGALHLCGDEGVPALLREAGWRVHQVGAPAMAR